MRRKYNTLYVYFIIIFLFSISFGYAVISRNLTINGNSEIKQNNWDVHFDYIYVSPDSVSATSSASLNSSKDTVNFSVSLLLPGDFYEFTVDVVNDGTMDAMIDSIVKTPKLTESQKKYLNYIIEYENGEQIQAKQLVSGKTNLRLKVRVEYRTDLTEIDLPTVTETLNLGFTINYVQSDNSVVSVANQGFKRELRVVNLTNNILGSEVCLGIECFYVIGFNENSFNLLSKYNLMVGNVRDVNGNVTPLENPTGIQNELARGFIDENSPAYGVIAFSETEYWWNWLSPDQGEFASDILLIHEGDFDIPKTWYIYNSKSLLYPHVENYKIYMENYGVNINNARLISLIDGLNYNGDFTDDFNNTAFWLGSAFGWRDHYLINVSGTEIGLEYNNNGFLGVRPVLEIPFSELGFSLDNFLK